MLTLTAVSGAFVTMSRNLSVTVTRALVAGGHVTDFKQLHAGSGSGAQTESTQSALANAPPRALQSASTTHCCRFGSTMTEQEICASAAPARTSEKRRFVRPSGSIF